MKVIVSHDVDHLYSYEHWMRDLYFPKLWFRETKKLLLGTTTITQWFRRCCSCFSWNINNIASLAAFDSNYKVPSTFFFGMNQGLNMSYKPNEAEKMIKYVIDHGFDVGVHGIAFDDLEDIKKERIAFYKLLGTMPRGIRMHYVRNSPKTQEYLSLAGYLFDSSIFDKEQGYTITNPICKDGIIEFPICLMDSYLTGDLDEMKSQTIKVLELAKQHKLDYFTLLFHDVYFSKSYSDYQKWYKWIIHLLSEDTSYSFISFEDAVIEIEGNDNDG